MRNNTELCQVCVQIKENTKHCKASKHKDLCFKPGSLHSNSKCYQKAAFFSELPTMLYQQQKTNSPRQQIIWIYWHHNTFKLETYLLSKVKFHPIENERLWEKMCNWWHLNRLRRSPRLGCDKMLFEVEGIQHSSSVRQLNSCSGLNGFCFYSSALQRIIKATLLYELFSCSLLFVFAFSMN